MSDQTPTLAYDLARDVTVVAAMAAHLTPYLYEDELYGPLAGDLPRLTVGGLLLRLHRLTRLTDSLSTEQQASVQAARANFEAERAQWAVHYEKKLVQELNARLRALEQFMAECTEKIRGCAASYPSQAEKRTIIAHLVAEATARDCLSDTTPARLAQLDQRVRTLFESGDFLINDDRLQVVYPAEEFWWLYGHLIEEKRT